MKLCSLVDRYPENKMLVSIYQIAWHHNAESYNLLLTTVRTSNLQEVPFFYEIQRLFWSSKNINSNLFIDEWETKHITWSPKLEKLF
jgi:hypothetical protein